MELSNQHYLGNDAANPFYYDPKPLAWINGRPIYEGDCCVIPCFDDDIPF